MSAPVTGCPKQEQARGYRVVPGFLIALLILALLRGLVYLVLFPPWQHYDEPTHFEYVRLIAQRGRLPSPGDYDPEMRLEIAASMQAAGFWKDLGAPAIEFWSDEPAWIGVSELEHPPVYYLLAAATQVLGANQSVELQLYLARLSSVFLGLVAIAAAYGLVAEAFPGRRVLPLTVATFMTFLAPFTGLMSSVNNDAGAAAAGALLLWSVVHLIRRGLTLRRSAVTLLLGAACVGTKSTSGAVALVALLALGAGFVARWQRRWLWIGLAVVMPVGLVSAFTLSGNAAHWYSESPAGARNHVQIDAPLGSSALALSVAPGERPRIVFQELERSVARSLRGQEVSYGAWLRSGEAAGGWVALNLYDGVQNHWYRVQATREWQFYAYSTTIDPKASGVAAYVIIPDRDGAAKTAYADGLVLAHGSLPSDAMTTDQGGQSTVTLSDGSRATNLLRNGSGERSWPALRRWIGNRTVGRSPLSVAFHSLWEVRRTGWVYTREVSALFKSFWGTFGWNHLSLSSAYFWIAGLVTAGSALGCGLWLIRHRRSRHGLEAWQWHIFAVLAASLITAWTGTVMRIHPVFTTRALSWPVARYAVGALVPTATLLCFGLSELVPRPVLRPLAWVGLLSWIAVDTAALLTVIVPYYYG